MIVRWGTTLVNTKYLRRAWIAKEEYCNADTRFYVRGLMEGETDPVDIACFANDGGAIKLIREIAKNIEDADFIFHVEC